MEEILLVVNCWFASLDSGCQNLLLESDWFLEYDLTGKTHSNVTMGPTKKSFDRQPSASTVESRHVSILWR